MKFTLSQESQMLFVQANKTIHILRLRRGHKATSSNSWLKSREEPQQAAFPHATAAETSNKTKMAVMSSMCCFHGILDDVGQFFFLLPSFLGSPCSQTLRINFRGYKQASDRLVRHQRRSTCGIRGHLTVHQLPKTKEPHVTESP